MAGNQGENGNFFDWEGFENSFFKEGAWKMALNAVPGGNLPVVEEYVQRLIQAAVPQAGAGRAARPRANSPHPYKVFETHEFVIVRIKTIQPAVHGLVRMFVGARELLVRGLPGEAELRIALPANVRLDGGKAVYKENVIEARLPKEKGEMFKELPIRFP